MAELKLQALDAEDLAILSAHGQDAALKVADMTFAARERRFALVCNRLDRTRKDQSGQICERHRAGLRFEQVNRVRFAGFDPKDGAHVLVLLAISWAPTEEPAGVITLQFAAGAAVKLEVAYIEAELKDLGAVWTTPHVPDHESGGGGSQPGR